MIPVIVTTDHRGVFFGYIEDATVADRMVHDKEGRIENARMCIFWSADMRGIDGLAAQGPSASCRIGHKASWKRLGGINSVTLVAPEAAQRWEDAPWSE